LRWGKFKNGISFTLRKAATIEVLPVTPLAAMRAMLNPSLRNRIQATIWSFLSLIAGYFNLPGIGNEFLCQQGVQFSALNRFAVHLTKLRYEARASISFADNLLATPGMGGAAAA
jgi:hypothetical protein